MQEDKEGVFDACDTAKMCLSVMAGMLPGMKARTDRMRKAASEGFINATDLADYLVTKGLPFRSAYKISGALVRKCIQEGKTLETLTLTEYREASPLIDEDVYIHIDLDHCVSKRVSEGGTSVGSVEKQIAAVRKELEP
jgi:argininosuccinate lyase